VGTVILRTVILVALIVTSLVAVASASASPTAELVVSESGSRVVLQATLVNGGAEPIKVLRRAIGADGLPSAASFARRDQVRLSRKELLKIAEIDVLHVEALLPAGAWSQVKVGLAGDVQPAVGGGTHRARVAVVDRVLDAGSGTFGVRLELPNPGHAIPAGTRCRLRLEGVDAPARRSAAPSAARP
jgi:hypothetical protein